jgi:hypothetical protein
VKLQCTISGVLKRSVTNSIIDSNRKRFSTIAQVCQDSLAILVEYPSASLVRVSNIFSDDWGVKLKATSLPAPGLGFLRKAQNDSCDLSAAWEIFSFGAGVWSAHYVAWRLHFTPELVEKVRLVAYQTVEQGGQFDFRGVAKCLGEYKTAHPLFP